MSDLDIEREPVEEKREFDPHKVSASRVNKLSDCGIAFKMKYLDRIPEQRQGSWALFGSVIHTALEKWATNREQDLLTLMRQAWVLETDGTAVKDFLAEYQTISTSVLKAEAAAAKAFEEKNKKPSQAPRMTKHFKESKACKDLNRLLARWLPKLEADSPWEFSERDPLAKFYDDSLVIAKRYEAQWKHLPPALHTEFSFDIPWRGKRLIGYIDAIELLLTPEGELQGVGVIDYKTYRREPAELKDWLQLVMYDVAFRYLVDEGVITLPVSLDTTPLRVGIDYVRFAHVGADWIPQTTPGNSRAFWTMQDADREALAKELDDYTGVVQGGYFRPAPKGSNPEFCDYGSLCCMRNAQTRGGCAERTEVVL